MLRIAGQRHLIAINAAHFKLTEKHGHLWAVIGQCFQQAEEIAATPETITLIFLHGRAVAKVLGQGPDPELRLRRPTQDTVEQGAKDERRTKTDKEGSLASGHDESSGRGVRRGHPDSHLPGRPDPDQVGRGIRQLRPFSRENSQTPARNLGGPINDTIIRCKGPYYIFWYGLLQTKAGSTQSIGVSIKGKSLDCAHTDKP